MVNDLLIFRLLVLTSPVKARKLWIPHCPEDDVSQFEVCHVHECGRRVRAPVLCRSEASHSSHRYVPSEGAAAVVLKTKRAALRDGDKIVAVVKSTSTMHDGRSQGLVAPNVKAQIAMQKALLRQAELEPSQLE